MIIPCSILYHLLCLACSFSSCDTLCTIAVHPGKERLHHGLYVQEFRGGKLHWENGMGGEKAEYNTSPPSLGPCDATVIWLRRSRVGLSFKLHIQVWTVSTVRFPVEPGPYPESKASLVTWPGTVAIPCGWVHHLFITFTQATFWHNCIQVGRLVKNSCGMVNIFYHPAQLVLIKNLWMHNVFINA